MTRTKNFIDYSSIESLAEIWPIAAKKFGDMVALKDPHAKQPVTLTYNQLCQQIEQFAAGLQAYFVKAESKVAIFADNSPRWLIADMGSITAGTTNVVRSSSADKDELLYILEDSDSNTLIVENLKTLKKLQPKLSELPIELIILLSDEHPQPDETIKIANFSDLMEAGSNYSLTPVTQTKDTIATLIYTSGTTGKPKGVMLSHGNLLHQVVNLISIIPVQPGDRALSILPSWHSYERSAEYLILSQGCTMIYTNIRYFKTDFTTFSPNYLVGVPRLWESLYDGIQRQLNEQPALQQKIAKFFLNVSEKYILARRVNQFLDLNNLNPSLTDRLFAKIQETLLSPVHTLGNSIVFKKIRKAVGGEVKLFVSGGGALANHLDNFYEIVGIPLVVGYGLTETSPVTNARKLERNLKGSAGQPIPHTKIKIVDLETKKELPSGKRGLVLIKGPQVMQGYYKKPEATAKVLDADGWFDSGDIGLLTPMNDLVLTGRAKDTIVLSNGENIEPQPIESACLRSEYIDQIVVLGQDQRSLGALIVPNLDNLKQWAKEQQLDIKLPELNATREEAEKTDLNSKAVQDLIKKELNREVQNRPGYRGDDRIGPFVLITEPFSMENGMMTQTLKIRRPVVTLHYRDIIDGMFEK